MHDAHLSLGQLRSHTWRRRDVHKRSPLQSSAESCALSSYGQCTARPCPGGTFEQWSGCGAIDANLSSSCASSSGAPDLTCHSLYVAAPPVRALHMVTCQVDRLTTCHCVSAT